MSGDAGEAAAQIVSEHERFALTARCRCGRDAEGQSHAAHVIHELQMAGLDVVWR